MNANQIAANQVAQVTLPDDDTSIFVPQARRVKKSKWTTPAAPVGKTIDAYDLPAPQKMKYSVREVFFVRQNDERLAPKKTYRMLGTFTSEFDAQMFASQKTNTSAAFVEVRMTGTYRATYTQTLKSYPV